MMRSRSALALSLLALLACALAPSGAAAANRCAGGGGPRPDEGGIGGTGMQQGAHDDGIGGTGLRPGSEEDDSGVGGTGIAASDTGVIGTITGFGSICVGGIEIHYDASSRVRVDGSPGTVGELSVGQVVEVVASGGGDELTAKAIGVTHIVAGPVTRVDADANAIDVAGQTVRLSSDTLGVSDSATAVAGDFSVGSHVQVSGLRQGDGSIAASRVSSGGGNAVWVTGAVTNTAPNEFAVAGTPVRTAQGSALTVGEEVRISGSWEDNQLVASSVERLPSLPFDGRTGRLEIEGFANRVENGQLRVGRYLFELPANAAAGLPSVVANARVNVRAVVDNGRAVIERVAAAPSLPPRPERPGGGGGAAPPRSMRQAPDGVPPPADGVPPGGRDALPPDGARPDAMNRPDQPVRPDQPMRPDRPDRPGGPAIPDRPPQIDRPQLPNRIGIPDRPPIPPRIGIPERPPRIERPQRPGP